MTDAADHQKVLSVIDSRFDEFVEELTEYARVPTISAHGTKFEEGAEATRRILEAHGARVRTIPEEGGPPVVVGEVLDSADVDNAVAGHDAMLTAPWELARVSNLLAEPLLEK